MMVILSIKEKNLEEGYKTMDFEKVIKHKSDIYIEDCPIDAKEGNCEICDIYSKILDKYDFGLNTKKWDYDD